MKIFENIRIGFDGVWTHKLRSLLTMLGIIFGVGAVVAMLSIGEGAKQEALKQIELMGVNNIIIQDAGFKDAQLSAARAAFSPGLTVWDAEAVGQVVSDVLCAVPVRIDEVDADYNTEKVKINLIGTNGLYYLVNNIVTSKGRLPDEEDYANNRRVCAVGNGIKKALFPFTDTVGNDIKINGIWFKIIGELENKNISTRNVGSYKVRNYNNDVLIPLSCSEKYFSRGSLKSPLEQIIVKVDKNADIHAVGNILQRIMNRRHHNQSDFEVVIPEELLRQSQSTQRIFNIVMGTIAGISLLVGGIGIMNIMLSSVLERTREIGIRRAVGATKNEIMGQFLTESVALSFSGGIIGIILGVALAKIITFYAGWITIVSLFSVLLAFGVATIVGLIFGLYPAKRAASLHPIEALRYE